MSKLPLTGLRIVDVTMIWAGPFATRHLADMGAEVIKIEGLLRPEPMRFSFCPDNDPGLEPWNRGGYFQLFNRNKIGISLGLNTQGGKEIFKQLIKISDAVIENYTPRVMDNFGLGYEILKTIKPDIIMVSMPGYGMTGPYSDYVAYGEVLEPMSGLSWLMGYSDGIPMRSAIAYGDPIAGSYGALAVLSALRYRRLTGKGQHVDLSQREALTLFAGESIIDYAMNGRIQSRIGNRQPRMAPHGCYRCRGEDEWVVISICSDEEWGSFCKAIGNPNWARCERFSEISSRLQHQDELDKLIEAYTVEHDHYEVMNLLQSAGIAAGSVLSNGELFGDPHLEERHFFQPTLHEENRDLPGAPWKFSKTPGGIRKPAPRWGQHNEYVFTELLGQDDATILQLKQEEAIGDAPLVQRRDDIGRKR